VASRASLSNYGQVTILSGDQQPDRPVLLKAASRGPSSDAEISTAIGPERGGLQICDLTRN